MSLKTAKILLLGTEMFLSISLNGIILFALTSLYRTLPSYLVDSSSRKFYKVLFDTYPAAVFFNETPSARQSVLVAIGAVTDWSGTSGVQLDSTA